MSCATANASAKVVSFQLWHQSWWYYFMKHDSTIAKDYKYSMVYIKSRWKELISLYPINELNLFKELGKMATVASWIKI